MALRSRVSAYVHYIKYLSHPGIDTIEAFQPVLDADARLRPAERSEAVS